MTTEPTRVNLSRALKLKNRLVHRLAQLDALILAENSTPEDNREYDVRALYEARRVGIERLVALKTAINEANRPIQARIFAMAELKGLVALLARVPTRHGPVQEGYPAVRVNYVAQLRKPEVETEVRRVEREIDRHQDELDRFNYQTLIAVDPALLDEEEPGPPA